MRQKVPLAPQAAAEVQLCQGASGGFITSFPRGFTTPEICCKRKVRTRASGKLSRQ